MTKSTIKKKIQKLHNQLQKKNVQKTQDNIIFIVLTDFFSGIFVGGFLGYFMDKFLNSTPTFLVIFTILGFLGSMLNIKRYTRKN